MSFHSSPRRLVAGAVAVATAAALALTFTTAAAQADGNGRDVLHATLTGAAEVPGPGDADGSGEARVYSLKDEADVICVALRVRDIDRASAAHIHQGAPTVAGPVRVPLTPPVGGFSQACVVSTAAQVADILANPEAYYVNVHNALHPAGAVRGQLS